MAHPRLRYLALATFLTLLVPALLLAQRPPYDSDYMFPPGITGTDARVFIGLQRGTILYADPAASDPMATDSVMIVDSAAPGGRLPSEVASIWYLAMPNPQAMPQLVTGLVSYRESGTPRYGFIRSTDLGETWTLIKAAALADASFVVSNDYWSWQTLSKMTWLPDARHGWIYGDKGIVSTSDGGDTWRIRFNGGADASTTGNNNCGHVNALAFKDSVNGVAALGWTLAPRLYLTVDGADTFYAKSAVYGYRPWVQIDWIGNEYRALQFDRTQLDNKVTTYFWSSSDGLFWEPLAIPAVTREQTYLTEILWSDTRTGVMVLRSGEMYRTTNRGRAWARYKDGDSASYPMRYSIGFGYRSVLLSDRIVQASTLRRDGALYRMIQWPVKLASVREQVAAPTARVSVAPNPANDLVTVDIGGVATNMARLSLVDATGRTVLQRNLERGASSVPIDVSGLPAGMYRVAVRNGGSFGSAPVIVR